MSVPSSILICENAICADKERRVAHCFLALAVVSDRATRDVALAAPCSILMPALADPIDLAAHLAVSAIAVRSIGL